MIAQRHLHESALIVHAHPEPRSFNSAQMRVARDCLTGQGYKVTLIDLYQRGWQPVLSRDEFPSFDGPFKPQREQWAAFRNGQLAAEVHTDLDLVLRADLLVLSFPLWWFSMPAILKGWIDRVFAMGAVSGGDAGLFKTAALAGKRARRADDDRRVGRGLHTRRRVRPDRRVPVPHQPWRPRVRRIRRPGTRHHLRPRPPRRPAARPRPRTGTRQFQCPGRAPVGLLGPSPHAQPPAEPTQTLRVHA
ncbi:MAG: NAD(P)H-dependent oxidoreductase [Acidipropionibacterium sp.]|nr:NAD(P)H-dependent oxidoreductase [Acidipropionibacterium sp.]